MGRLDVSPRANWVEKKGGLPDYIDRIAVHLHDGGAPIGVAIATAINAAKKMCSTGDLNWPGLQHVNPGSRSEACAAVSQWEAMKTSHEGEPVLALASWNSMLHPRVPAGQAGGGKFAKGSGGAKKTGKGGAKGKGAKGGAGSAAAQAAAQARTVAPQFLAMNPQQRAAFLAKLTNPQLAALYKVINAGNSNDPSTKAALVAIKDQMAARSLTGAKGPTAIAQGKAATAAKSAASKQASAAKKTASANASAAKKATAAQTAAAKKQATAQAAAAKQAAANQSATVKAQAAMQATTQKAKVGGLTAALKSATDPAAQAQILGQLKTALGLAQTAPVADVLALAGDHRYRHGWVKLDSPDVTPAMYAARGKTLRVGQKEAIGAALNTPGHAIPKVIGDDHRDLTARGYIAGPNGSAKLTEHGRTAAQAVRDGNPIPDKKEPQAAKNARQKASMAATTNRLDVAAADALAAHLGVSRAVAVSKVQAMSDDAIAALPSATRKAAGRVSMLSPTEAKALTASHVTSGALALSMPMVSSQDGPQVTMNDALKTPHDIRRAVAAHGQVPPHMRPGYRKTVKKAAKRIGAEHHVPNDWMTTSA